MTIISTTVGKNPLEEMEKPSWSTRVLNAVLGCNLKNDRMISVHFQGNPFNITVIHVYALLGSSPSRIQGYPQDDGIDERIAKQREQRLDLP